MTDTMWCDVPVDEGWTAACGLVSRLGDGHPLPVIDLEFMGATDEELYVNVATQAWSWTAGPPATWEHREFVDFRGICILALTAAASAIGNRRRRLAAAQATAPQWRAMGPGPVRALLTSQRLIVCTGDDASSLWFDEDLPATYDLAARHLELRTPMGVPIVLRGQWVPYLTVALIYRMTAGTLELSPDQATSTAATSMVATPFAGQVPAVSVDAPPDQPVPQSQAAIPSP
jgi:hypothetical protein